MSADYSSLSVAELRQIIKDRGIKNTSSLRKQQLVELLTQLDAGGHKKTKTEEVQQEKRQEERPAQQEIAVEAEQTERVQRERNPQRQDRKTRTPQGTSQRGDNSGRQTGRRQTQYQGQSRAGQGQNQQRQQAQQQSAGAGRNVQQQGQSRQMGTSQRNSGQTSRSYAAQQSSRQNNESIRQSSENIRQVYAPQEAVLSGASPVPLTAEEREIPGFSQLDSGNMANGILEVLSDGYGFIRCENYLPGENDVYVSHTQIRRFNLKTGDIVSGNIRVKNEKEKFSALLYVRSVNGGPPEEAKKRCNFEDMTPVFPDEKINLETPDAPVSMRIMNLLSPIGRGQRGMIVAPPKTGKTTLLKQVARAIHTNYPDMNMIILLIDERPEEVTDIKEYIEGENVEVIYSTFDERPEHHERVSEMVLERAKRLVEHKKDVVILLDSITRLARACNLTVQPSGRTLTGGLDPAALYMPKRFFGSARNMREGGSLTVLATALVETGSKMDDVVFEEFKGTGNMELVLDRRLSDKRIFPAINLPKSGTRRDDLLLTKDEIDATYAIRHALGGVKSEEAFERILEMIKRTKNNQDFLALFGKSRYAAP